MNAYIITGFRSAVGKAKKGGFKNYRSDDLAVDILNYLALQIPQLDVLEIDDVIVGCANPEGEQGLQVGRLIASRAFGKSIPGMTINRYFICSIFTFSVTIVRKIFVIFNTPMFHINSRIFIIIKILYRKIKNLTKNKKIQQTLEMPEKPQKSDARGSILRRF